MIGVNRERKEKQTAKAAVATGEVIGYHITMKDFTVLITAVLLFLFCRVADGALSTLIESGEEECYAVRAPPGATSMIRWVHAKIIVHLIATFSWLFVLNN